MASTRAATRNAVTDLIGPAKPLPVGDLASNRCVLQQMILLRLEDPRDNRHIPIKELARKTAELLIENWRKLTIKLFSILRSSVISKLRPELSDSGGRLIKLPV